jgi:hypothetical protein
MNPNIEPKTLQSVIFLATFDISNKIKIANDINDALGGIFDGNPTILPIPDDAAAELPRIILSSRDGSYTCNISPKRIDLITNLSISDEPSIDQKESQFLEKTIAALKAAVAFHGVAERYALLLASNITATADPIVLLKKSVTDEIASTAKELQLHTLYEIAIDGLASNHWIRAISQNSGKEEASLSILSDINTAETENETIRELTSTDFFSEALKLAKKDAVKIIGA